MSFFSQLGVDADLPPESVPLEFLPLLPDAEAPGPSLSQEIQGHHVQKAFALCAVHV